MKTPTLQSIKDQATKFLNELGISAVIEDEGDVISIEPNTRTTGTLPAGAFDGMRLVYWKKENEYEVAEYQAGEKEDQLHIFKVTPMLKVALKDLIKGNKRKPIKIY